MPKKHRIEPDPEVVRRLATMTLALPEAYEEEAWTGVRWRIRQKTFAHVMVAQEGYESSLRDITGIREPTTVLTFHSSGDELLVLSNAPLPFYKPPWSATIVGLMLGDGTDWTEVAELLTESYRCCAPQKLVRLIDERSVVLSLLGGVPDLEDLGGETADGGGHVTHR